MDGVPDAVAFHQLEFGVTVGVSHLGDKRITVSHHRPNHNCLTLPERKAVRDIDTLRLLDKILLVLFGLNRVIGV